VSGLRAAKRERGGITPENRRNLQGCPGGGATLSHHKRDEEYCCYLNGFTWTEGNRSGGGGALGVPSGVALMELQDCIRMYLLVLFKDQ